MKIYIAPVSGESFPIQLASFVLLSKAFKNNTSSPIIPDVVFCSSGGNLSTWLSKSASWDDNRILGLSSLVESKYFVTDWFGFIPGILFLPFAKSYYRPGYGFTLAVKNFYPSDESVRSRTEIWTGVYQPETSTHQVFCNKAIENAFFKPSDNIIKLGNGNNPPIYYNGDRNKLSKIIMASASIPLITQPVTIDGINYIDGGTIYASPLVCFSNDIVTKIKTQPSRRFEGFYFSPQPLFKFGNSDNSFGFIDEFKTIIRSNRYNDIRIFIDILKSFGASEDPKDIYINLKDPNQLYTVISNASNNGNNHYGILFFPNNINNKTVILSDIQYGNLNKKINSSLEELNVAVWYVPA